MGTNNEQEQQVKKRKPAILPLVIVVVVLLVSSFAVAGFVLGRYAGAENSGMLIDTIILSPVGEQTSSGEEITHFLSGAVYDKNDIALNDVSVKMGDKSRQSVDANGRFFFTDVRNGSYNLRVYKNEVIIAEAAVSLSFDRNGNISIDTGDENSLTVPFETRVVELKLIVDDGKLIVDSTGSGMVTNRGEVVDFNSKKISVLEGEMAVTNTGSLVTHDGHIVFPSSAEVITPGGFVDSVLDTGYRVPGVGTTMPIRTDSGVQVDGDGTVTSNDDVIYAGDGTIVIKDREIVVVDPVEDYVPPMAADELEPTENSGESIDNNKNVDSNENIESNESMDNSESTNEIINPDPDELPKPSPSPTPAPSADPTHTPVPTEPPMEGFDVKSVDTGESWTQQSIVNLFKEKKRKTPLKPGEIDYNALGEENGVPIIAPGSTGIYTFRIKNDNDYSILYTLGLSEKTFHLPLQFSLYRVRDNKLFSYKNKMYPDEGVLTPEIEISPHTEIDFKLEWIWDFENRWSPDEDNAYDTQAALGAEAEYYIIGLNIKALQIIPPKKPGDDTLYPGQTPKY